jgi:hypothetical protein
VKEMASRARRPDHEATGEVDGGDQGLPEGSVIGGRSCSSVDELLQARAAQAAHVASQVEAILKERDPSSSITDAAVVFPQVSVEGHPVYMASNAPVIFEVQGRQGTFFVEAKLDFDAPELGGRFNVTSEERGQYVDGNLSFIPPADGTSLKALRSQRLAQLEGRA